MRRFFAQGRPRRPARPFPQSAPCPKRQPGQPQGTDHDRTRNHPGADCRAWAEARRICARAEHHRARADIYRTGHLFGDVERALFLQIVEEMAAHPAHHRTSGDLRAGRECGRGRYRRRAGGGLQDGKPQPPQLHRAASGRCHRRGRHFARCLHHGRAAHCGDECAQLRRAVASQDRASGQGRGRRRGRLRQCLWRADRGRRGAVPPRL